MRNLTTSFLSIFWNAAMNQEIASNRMADISNLRKTMAKGPYDSLAILNQTKVRLHKIFAVTTLIYTPAVFFAISLACGIKDEKNTEKSLPMGRGISNLVCVTL